MLHRETEARMASGTATDRASAPRRRFTLLDGMILVAATAVGYALVHVLERLIGEGDFLSLIREAWTGREFAKMALLLYLVALPVLAAWTVALIPLRLLKPRPRSRRMARQPGLMAGIAASMAIGFMGLVVGIMSVSMSWLIGGLDQVVMLQGVLMLPASLGLAVLVAWTTLLLGRRWRAEPSWIDRLGRIIGVAWVLLGLASPFALLFL